MVDLVITDETTLTELDCKEACMQWLSAFMQGDDRLVVDYQYEIYKEYRNEIQSHRPLAYAWLNQLQRAPRHKEVWVSIVLDEHGHAKIPIELQDEADRKFVAAALAHTPIPPIIDATDTDWEKDKAKLTAVGLTVQELCPAYIADKLTIKGI